MAARYFVDGGVDNNWGTTGNWSTTSGGAGGSSVPNATDDVFLDGNSPNCTVNTSARSALTFTTTGYTNTITMSQNITVSGAITIGASTVFSGSGILRGQSTATHTSNGVTIPNFGLLGSGATHTLADNFNVTNFYYGSSNQSLTVNGFKISISGNLDLSVASSGTLSGTTELETTGTGSLLLMTSTGTLRNNLTFNNGSGTFTGASGSFKYNTGTLTYTSGTVDMTATALDTAGIATTISTTSAVHWNGGAMIGSVTYTLGADLYFSGAPTLGNGASATVINSNKIYCLAGLNLGVSTGSLSGTAIIVAAGTGTFAAASITTGRLLSVFYIDASGATVTFTSVFNLDMGQVKFFAGTVITDAGTWVSGGGSTGSSFVFGG